ALAPSAEAPRWVRLVRERNTFTGYYSSDGENWILLEKSWPQPDPHNCAVIDMEYDVLVGLFVTSHDSSKLCRAVFDHVNVTIPAGTAMTYQGYLMDQGTPVNGLHDLQFKLYDAPVGGRQIGATYDASELDIVDGYLATVVFFGGGPDIFNGEARWLEMAVKPSSEPQEAYTLLEPRQRITPAPYAVHAHKPVGPEGKQGPPGPKGDMPDHEIYTNQGRIRFENPDGSWGSWLYAPRGTAGPPGPVPDHLWDPDTRCLQFQIPCPDGSTTDKCWGPCINLDAMDDSDWIIDGDNVYRLFGRVGILTDQPTQALDVAGQACFDGALLARDGTGIGFKDAAGALGLWVETGGNVGVCTNDPVQELDVNGQGRFDGSIFARDTTGIGFVDQDGDLGLWVRDGGNVGVRTTTPQEELDVAGQGRFDGEIFARDTDGIGLVDRIGRDGVWVRDGGNVGVGTRTADVKLDVRGNARIAAKNDGIVNIHSPATATRLTLDADEIQARYADAASPLFLNRLGGDVLLVTTAGRVGIATDSPEIGVAIRDPDTGLDAARAGELDVWANGVKMLSVRSGGLGVKVSNPTEALDISGTARLRSLGQGSGTPVVADGSGKLWKESSSRRYKDNVRDLEPASEAVLALRPVRFQWKTTGREEIGLIAEEVAQLASDLVIYDAEGRPEGVKYNKLSLYLLSVIRSQQERIDALESESQKYDFLERRIASLERASDSRATVAKELTHER
ncbi:MAG: tail fiber domain-containing protein, partial [Sedimentisphaerales bacterium]|nr:tail fiber domain-containing protein [Sedimentisphaerales bacterium]